MAVDALTECSKWNRMDPHLSDADTQPGFTMFMYHTGFLTVPIRYLFILILLPYPQDYPVRFLR
jgi:hypothetical protein